MPSPDDPTDRTDRLLPHPPSVEEYLRLRAESGLGRGSQLLVDARVVRGV